MKIIIENNKFKKTVLFIHGFGKTGEQWNITEYGKEINIESHIRKTHNTILVTLHDDDYFRSISDVSDEIDRKIEDLIKTKIICVTHSYGSFYAISMSIKFKNLFDTIIMLDPTIKTPEYLQYLKTLNYSEKNQYQIDNFDIIYPNHLDIPKNIIVKIHLNINDKNENSNIINDLTLLGEITKHNVKSRLMIHIGVSHMIHYKIPHVIIDSIKNS